jgi:hypothetical protein
LKNFFRDIANPLKTLLTSGGDKSTTKNHLENVKAVSRYTKYQSYQTFQNSLFVFCINEETKSEIKQFNSTHNFSVLLAIKLAYFIAESFFSTYKHSSITVRIWLMVAFQSHT